MKKKFQTNSRVRANEHIRVPQIRLVDEKGEQVGIVETSEGMTRAQEAGLDLVEVAPLAKPPVCRLMDLGKYIYSLSKKEKESRKKQKTITVKEVKLSCKIEEHDYQTKLRKAQKFLERGDKVKLTLFFRGREITHKDLGEKLVQRFIRDLEEDAQVERNDGLEGNIIHVYFAPLPQKPVQKKKSPKKDKETEEENAETQNEQSSQEKI